MVTDRDILILRAVSRYYVLNRHQIQRLIFPEDIHGRVTRRRLQSLIDADLLNRQPMLVCHPQNGVPAPVYYPSPKGIELLAEFTGDDRFLATATQAPTMHHVWHWLAVSETHIAFDQAISLQTADSPYAVRVVEWLNEYDVVNPAETLPEKRFHLYTLLRSSPRLICAPDAALLLNARGHSKVFYLEEDRATTGVHQIAASKSQGYAVLAEVSGHRRHFPQATIDTFTVLMIAPTARRRDALRKAFREKQGAALWRFASVEDLKPERLLFEPIWYPCDGEPASLIKPNPLSEGESS
ncbi:MAG: Uncharacterized protein FD138_2379 [Planctomycetota bacterium]|nr:MAG: Uncharacterized protein FD138_2379 [Planctomycetota bacterium]